MNLINDIDVFEAIFDMIAMLNQYTLLALSIYQLVISAFGFLKRKDVPGEKFAPVNRFALVVAAHNEETVVGNIVRNLNKLKYPRDMYDIFVIADNCEDNTAAIARKNGAIVYERFDNEKKGKGFALEWMFEKLLKMRPQYDAVCIFDADNLVSLNFLAEMNKQLSRGYEVVQGYLDSKNPKDSIVAGSYAITYWMTNRLFQLARYNLGLSCAVGGTGFAISTKVLKEIGWGATCLTEDLEFSMRLVLKGKKVYWAHDAVVYDEKPLTLKQSLRQRKRWMQGHADCAVRYFKPLLKMAFKKRSMVAFDAALYVIQPLIVVICAIGMLAGVLRYLQLFDPSGLFTTKTLLSALLLFASTYGLSAVAFIDGKLSLKAIGYVLLLPFYNLTWVPVIILGFKDRNKKEWMHTIHTRAMDINDIKDLKGVA